MKKIIAFLVTFGIIITTCFFTFALEPEEEIVNVVKEKNPKVTIDDSVDAVYDDSNLSNQNIEVQQIEFVEFENEDEGEDDNNLTNQDEKTYFEPVIENSVEVIQENQAETVEEVEVQGTEEDIDEDNEVFEPYVEAKFSKSGRLKALRYIVTVPEENGELKVKKIRLNKRDYKYNRKTKTLKVRDKSKKCIRKIQF